MTKAPILGSVKSRLAAEIGVHHALELYRCFLLDIIKVLRQIDSDYIVYYTPSDALPELSNFLGEQTYWKQVGVDLGERLFNGLKKAYVHGYSHAVAMASDIPDIPLEYLLETLEALRTSDAVIGPSTDGGYNLIGLDLSMIKPSIFSGVNWGTETVLDETLKRLEDYCVHVLPVWSDIDRVADLEKHIFYPESMTYGYLQKHKLV